jgi:ATPase family associated with various cellular activities (AAA)
MNRLCLITPIGRNFSERKAIHTPGKKRRARLSLDSSGAFSPQIQRSPAHADGSMESKKSSVPSNASPRARRQGAPSPPSRINSVETAGRVVAEVEVDSSSPSPSIAISPLTRSSPNQTSSKSRRQILMACKDLPTKSSEIVYPPNSSFEASVKKVESFVRRVIASEGGHGSSEDMPAFLYVCGAPGLGKTAAVRACCDRLAKERRDDDIRKPRVCYVNASSMDASPQPDAVLLQRIAETLEMNSKFPQIKRIKSSMTTKKAQVVLIVDEIDILLSETDDASSSVKSKQEEALVMLADWAGDPDVSIGVIGISNRKGNTKYERLKQLGRVSESMRGLPAQFWSILHCVWRVWFDFAPTYSSRMLSTFCHIPRATLLTSSRRWWAHPSSTSRPWNS